MTAVYGLGTYRPGAYPSRIGRKLSPHYNSWKSMLLRCASKPGVTCGEDFSDFQTYAAWADCQLGFNTPGYQLDKDLLVKGNKCYASERCAFIPKHLNTLIDHGRSSRGEWPVGVRYRADCNRFQASVSEFGVKRELGYFRSVEQAFIAYKVAKEAHIKRVAEMFRDRVDLPVYKALLAYTVDIDD